MMDIHRYENALVVIYKNDQGEFCELRRVRKARGAADSWVGSSKNDERAEERTEKVFSTQSDAVDWAKGLRVFS